MTAGLPSNWVSTTLGSFCKFVNGRSFKSSEWSEKGLPIIRIQNLRNPKASYNLFSGVPNERHTVKSGDLLFAWSGTPGTSFGAHIWSGGDAVLNQHIFKVVFDNEVASAHFLKIAINANLPDLIKQAKGGSGLKHLTRSMVESIPISLPPRLEQDRIISLLADTVGRLVAVEAELTALIECAPAVERHVLAAVIDGTLSTTEAKAPNKAATIAKDFSACRIEDAGEIILGRQRSPSVHEGPFMRPYLRVANVFDDYIDPSDLKSMNFNEDEFERYRLKPGDILLNEGQSLKLVGRAAMFRGEPADVCFTNTLIRYRASSHVDPEYALLVFRAYQHTGKFQKIAKITTNLAHLGTQRFAQLSFPMRPLDQQREIARAARSLIDKIRCVTDALLSLRSEAISLIYTFETSALTGKSIGQSASETTLAILSKKERQAVQNQSGGSVTRRTIVQRNTGMPTITLVKALIQSNAALSAQELFDAAGYPEDASVLQVEQFFLELRSALAQKQVRRTVTNGERFISTEPES